MAVLAACAPLRASRRRAPRRLAATPRASAAPQAPPKRVAVVGAGVAGLTLALALKRLCPSAEVVDVYEAEGDAELRADRGAALNLNGAWRGARAAAPSPPPLHACPTPHARAPAPRAGGAAVLTDLGLGPQLAALSNPMENVRSPAQHTAAIHLATSQSRAETRANFDFARDAVAAAGGGAHGGRDDAV